MKLVTETKSFRDAWSRIAPLAQRRTPKPILQNVLLSFDGERAYLSATDLQTWMRIELRGVECDGKGEVLLPSYRISSIVSATGGEHLNIEVADEKLTVRTGFGRHDLNTEKAVEYPMGRLGREAKFKLPGYVLATAINRVTPMADDGSEARYAMKAVRLEVRQGKLTAVASRSAGMFVYEAGAVDGDDCEMLIPLDESIRLARQLKEETGDCEAGFAGEAAFFNCGGLNFTTSQLAGRYPRWQDCIPKTEVDVPLAPDAFLAAIREAKTHTSEDSVGVDFDIADGILTLSCRNGHDGGKGQVQVPVNCDTSLATAFYPDYIVDFVKACDHSQPLTVGFYRKGANDKATKFTSGDKHYMVLMPLKRTSQ